MQCYVMQSLLKAGHWQPDTEVDPDHTNMDPDLE